MKVINIIIVHVIIMKVDITIHHVGGEEGRVCQIERECLHSFFV